MFVLREFLLPTAAANRPFGQCVRGQKRKSPLFKTQDKKDRDALINLFISSTQATNIQILLLHLIHVHAQQFEQHCATYLAHN
jgi:hypothetical protein